MVLGIILLLFAAFGVLSYPGNALWLALGLGAYALALLRKPNRWLVALPALLPVLDLGQWTGWLFVDEFDLFVMVTIGVLTLLPPPELPQRWPGGLKFLLTLWAILAVFAFIHGFLPMDALSSDSFWGIHGHTNALRIGRGILWAILLLVLLPPWGGNRNQVLDLFAKGMTLGLVAVGLAVLWERVTFAGWWNFTSDYRAVGALSAVSTAGARRGGAFCAAHPVPRRRRPVAATGVDVPRACRLCGGRDRVANGAAWCHCLHKRLPCRTDRYARKARKAALVDRRWIDRVGVGPRVRASSHRARNLGPFRSDIG